MNFITIPNYRTSHEFYDRDFYYGCRRTFGGEFDSSGSGEKFAEHFRDLHRFPFDGYNFYGVHLTDDTLGLDEYFKSRAYHREDAKRFSAEALRTLAQGLKYVYNCRIHIVTDNTDYLFVADKMGKLSSLVDLFKENYFIELSIKFEGKAKFLFNRPIEHLTASFNRRNRRIQKKIRKLLPTVCGVLSHCLMRRDYQTYHKILKETRFNLKYNSYRLETILLIFNHLAPKFTTPFYGSPFWEYGSPFLEGDKSDKRGKRGKWNAVEIPPFDMWYETIFKDKYLIPTFDLWALTILKGKSREYFLSDDFALSDYWDYHSCEDVLNHVRSGRDFGFSASSQIHPNFLERLETIYSQIFRKHYSSILEMHDLHIDLMEPLIERESLHQKGEEEIRNLFLDRVSRLMMLIEEHYRNKLIFYPSQMDSTLAYNNDYWVVSLTCDDSVPQSERVNHHARIVVEGIEGGNHFLKRADFVADQISFAAAITLSIFGIPSKGRVRPFQDVDISQYRCDSKKSWIRSASLVRKMMKSINKDAQKDKRFNIFGSFSLFNRDAQRTDNCITYAAKKLKSIEVYPRVVDFGPVIFNSTREVTNPESVKILKVANIATATIAPIVLSNEKNQTKRDIPSFEDENICILEDGALKFEQDLLSQNFPFHFSRDELENRFFYHPRRYFVEALIRSQEQREERKKIKQEYDVTL